MKAQLTKEIEGDLTIKIRFMGDRQDLIEEQKLREEGLKPHMHDRKDMYWVDVFIGGTEVGTASIDPSFDPPGSFYISKQHSDVDADTWNRMTGEIRALFEGTPEHASQIGWMQKLAAAGYNKKTHYLPCEVCSRGFAILGKHLHRRFENRIYPYHSSDVLFGRQEILDEWGSSYKVKQYS